MWQPVRVALADDGASALQAVLVHRPDVVVKLAVHSKLEAAALAVHQGLVRVEEPMA